MNKHHLEEGHSIHHVGNVYALCCDCGCCHSAACMEVNPPICFATTGEGACLDGMTNDILDRPEIEATAERLLDY